MGFLSALSRIDQTIGHIVERKIEELGSNVIDGLISATPIGAGLAAVKRFESVIETGGGSEIDRLRGAWLNSLRLPVPPGAKIFRSFEKPINDATHARRKFRWQRGGWARSRQEWLDEGWRHDWRSQPRDLLGRWIPGRLSYPVTDRLPVSRRNRRLRKKRRAYRKIGRSIGMGLTSTWSRD